MTRSRLLLRSTALIMPLVLVSGPASAGPFDFLDNTAKKIQKKLEGKANKEVDKAIDGTTGTSSGKDTPVSHGYSGSATGKVMHTYSRGAFAKSIGSFDAHVEYCEGSRDTNFRKAALEVLEIGNAASHPSHRTATSQFLEWYESGFDYEKKRLNDPNFIRPCEGDWRKKYGRAVKNSYAEYHTKFNVY